MTDIDHIPAGHPIWADVVTPDLDAAIAFYTKLFGWKAERGEPEFGGYSSALLKGRRIAGIAPAMGDPAPPPAWTTYFGTDSADGTAKLISDNGGTLIAEPMDVGTLGRMLIAIDPAGAFFGAWQPGDHTGFQIRDVPGTPCWFELTSTDHRTANDFYAAVFDWTYDEMGDDTFTYTVAKVGDTVIGGTWPKPAEMPAEIPSHWMVYFAVEDTDKSAATIGKLGGAIDREPWDTPYGRMAVAHDPAGAHFSVMVPQPPEA